MSKVPICTHLVLVHGGWCWYKIRCLLESIGQKVSCLDLASCGIDTSDADTISTFEEYNKPLHDILASLPPSEKVILVGHSAGGLSLTHAIHDFPEKVQVAVFVAAIMLRNGFLPHQQNYDGKDKVFESKELHDYGYGQGGDNPPTSIILKRDAQREVLYQMSPLEDCTLASMLLRPCPIKALSGAIFPDDKDDYEKVPRVYINTMHDNVFSQEYQDSMIENWPPSDVFSIDSDHSPMFSNPSQLFSLLSKIAFDFKDH